MKTKLLRTNSYYINRTHFMKCFIIKRRVSENIPPYTHLFNETNSHDFLTQPFHFTAYIMHINSDLPLTHNDMDTLHIIILVWPFSFPQPHKINFIVFRDQRRRTNIVAVMVNSKGSDCSSINNKPIGIGLKVANNTEKLIYPWSNMYN